MGRYFRRRALTSPLAIPTLLIAVVMFAGGCGGGFVYPPPTLPADVQKEVFHISDPIALLSFEPGRTKGHIFGALHDWPAQSGGGSIPSNFTYVGQFTVITKSDEDGMPTAAEGTRKVFFHEQMPQLSFGEASAYGTGQEVALDAISLSFVFKENHKIVGVRMVSRQKNAEPFTLKDRKIQPPKQRDSADTLQGEYSADFGGYVLRSLNE